VWGGGALFLLHLPGHEPWSSQLRTGQTGAAHFQELWDLEAAEMSPENFFNVHQKERGQQVEPPACHPWCVPFSKQVQVRGGAQRVPGPHLAPPVDLPGSQAQ
jgi:hypothetical protein